jgi:hypothetical protein
MWIDKPWRKTLREKLQLIRALAIHKLVSLSGINMVVCEEQGKDSIERRHHGNQKRGSGDKVLI